MIVDQRPVVVFLGPSCSAEEARRILPDALILPPIKCGDMLQALRLRPSRIAIIDGVFREVAAVWHKEILHALDSGVEVWGAASMGALRAAELSDFGMRGFGSIFSDYRSGVLTDDDEVALVIGQIGDCYLQLSDAMVNIRATLARAVEQSVVTADHAFRIRDDLKRLHYKDRHLAAFLEGQQDRSSADLLQWLEQGNLIDLKREDALGLLAHLQGNEVHPPSPLRTRPTLALRRLHLRIMTAPLDFTHCWLPLKEQRLQAWESRPFFPLLRRLAHFLALFDGLVNALGAASTPSTGSPFSNGIAGELEDPELRSLVKGIDALLTGPHGPPGGSWQSSYRASLKIEDMYEGFLLEHDDDIGRHQVKSPMDHRILYLLAQLEGFHRAHLARLGLRPQADRVQERTLAFRRARGLYSGADTEAWMERNDLDQEGMQDLMVMECNYHYLVEGCFFEHLGFLEPPHSRCWLQDAVALVEDS